MPIKNIKVKQQRIKTCCLITKGDITFLFKNLKSCNKIVVQCYKFKKCHLSISEENFRQKKSGRTQDLYFKNFCYSNFKIFYTVYFTIKNTLSKFYVKSCFCVNSVSLVKYNIVSGNFFWYTESEAI